MWYNINIMTEKRFIESTLSVGRQDVATSRDSRVEGSVGFDRGVSSPSMESLERGEKGKFDTLLDSVVGGDTGLSALLQTQVFEGVNAGLETVFEVLNSEIVPAEKLDELNQKLTAFVDDYKRGHTANRQLASDASQTISDLIEAYL